eukprot:6207126-Pleurochrysis_carterae.AAC.1
MRPHRRTRASPETQAHRSTQRRRQTRQAVAMGWVRALACLGGRVHGWVRGVNERWGMRGHDRKSRDGGVRSMGEQQLPRNAV